jgi:hypothetical protein
MDQSKCLQSKTSEKKTSRLWPAVSASLRHAGTYFICFGICAPDVPAGARSRQHTSCEYSQMGFIKLKLSQSIVYDTQDKAKTIWKPVAMIDVKWFLTSQN